MREVATARLPWDAHSTDGRLNVAFGRSCLTFVKDGDRITLARLDPNGNAEVQLSPGLSMEAVVDTLLQPPPPW